MPHGCDDKKRGISTTWVAIGAFLVMGMMGIAQQTKYLNTVLPSSSPSFSASASGSAPCMTNFGNVFSSGDDKTKKIPYRPSKVESYFLKEGRTSLALDNEDGLAEGCTAWNDPQSPIATELAAFIRGMDDYQRRLSDFKGSTVPDLRKEIARTGDHSICDTLELHPDGLLGIFSPFQKEESNDFNDVLTQTVGGGWVEPLFPPMRSPKVCKKRSSLMSMEYLIHDFASYCRRLTPMSRIVLVDMGASLEFHGGSSQPAIYLTSIFQKFGFHFDHIYAYEITKTDPAKVIEKVPNALAAAYHWINVGVDSDPTSKRNPWKMLLEEYTENDFVIVKLDIDTSEVEMQLVKQLLKGDLLSSSKSNSTSSLHSIVDAFYFEHHVKLKELSRNWREKADGSVLSSLELFASLREKGIDSHYWV